MIALLILLFVAPQAEAERLFRLGNALVAEGDFRGAAAAYEGVFATGWTSTALHLNLGAAYAEAGDVGRAVLHAERARALAPRDATVQQRADAIRRRLGIEVEPPPTAGDAVAAWLSARVGASGVAAALLVVFLAALGLAAAQVWTRRPSPWRRRTLAVLAALGLALAALVVLVARYEARPRAVVMAVEVPVRAGPSAEAAVTATLAEGRLVVLGERRGPWRAVRLADGAVGWAEAAALAPVTPE